MLEFEMFMRLLLSMALGALVGAERERFAKKESDLEFGGIRTFIFICLLGSLSSILADEIHYWVLIAAFIGMIVFIAVGYHSSIELSKGKSIGITGEIAAILVFLVGVMTMTDHIFLAIASAILITAFLYLKQRLHGFLKNVSEQEVYGTIIFAIIAFVILPFLPNETYGPLDVFNPYKVWLMVVLICAMGYIGYILMKIFGAHKGIWITGLLGGLVSSTAVTMSMAEQSKKETNVDFVKMFVIATVIANFVMLIRVITEIIIVNPMLLNEVIVPIMVMALCAIIGAGIMFMRSHKVMKNHQPDIIYKSPLSLGPALKFGLLFAVVLFVIKAAQTYLGDTGVFVASIITGFVDVDAITLSMANLAGNGLPISTASNAIILAVMSNTVIKLGYGFIFGSREFSKKLAIVMGCVILSGLIMLIF
jgi:uncharacterized membrane protein (DUF4010 family)